MNVAPLYRTFWQRFWAGYVDVFVFAPAMTLDWWIQHHWSSDGARATWFAFYVALFPAYQVYMHGRFGQTVGKRLLRVKVVNLSGAPLTMRQAFRREAINLPFGLWSLVAGVVLILRGGSPYDPDPSFNYGPPAGLSLGLFVLEILSTLGSLKRRALHDLVAGSVVIRVGPLPASPVDDTALVQEPVATASRPPTAGEFACTACGNPVRVGASHCHACGESFTYRDGSPTVQS
jgi:uncharacterized RDD family membrane protein YckC